MIIEFLRLS